jgi:hypothetical protein
VRKTSRLLVVVLLLLITAAISTPAQNAVNQSASDRGELNVVKAAALTTPASPAPQAVINSLSSLPEADALIYVNAQRILNEILPKFLPAKDLEEMRKGFAEAKQSAGIDPGKVDYLVLAVRFKKPTGDLNFQAPEFMVVSSGDFSAESLLTLARMATQGKLRDETYGGKTMGLMTLDPVVKEAEKMPLLKSFTEVGIVALNANTIATGSPGYLRAAIDAANGKDRIGADVLSSLVRDPNVIMSFAGTPWRSFSRSFGMMGTETTARAPRCDSKFGDVYVALTMDATNFMVRGVSNADNPDTAKIIANLYSGLFQYATSAVPDKSVQAILKGFTIAAEGDEVLVSADFPQQMVLQMIQQQMKPKPVETTEVKQITKPVTRRHRTRRRH